MLGLVSSRFRIQRLFLKNFFSQVHQTEAILSNSRRLFHTVESVLYVSSVSCLIGCIKRPKGRSFILSLIFTCLHLEKKRVLISSQIFDKNYDIYAEAFWILTQLKTLQGTCWTIQNASTATAEENGRPESQRKQENKHIY
jgi:hypothetical protein